MSARRTHRRGAASTALLLACVLPPALGGGDREAASFALDVLPLFERLGCSSAYCHGSATGRGGFKLSLFGSDPHADWLAIREELGGRRLDFVEPAQSLLLRKPTRAMKHGGGRVLDPASPAYERLASWIASGAPWSDGEVAAVGGLRLVRDGERLRAVARVGGTERDVSELARYWSSDDSVASVDRQGAVRETGDGQAWLFARYAGTTARLRIVRGGRETAAPSEAGASLDTVSLAALAELGLEPAPPAEPLALLRRVSLDLAGRPPALAEIKQFQAAEPAERLATAVDRLLAAPEFALVWGEHLARWLEVKDAATAKDYEASAQRSLRESCRGFVAARRPLSELPRTLLSGELAPLLRQNGDPRDRAEHWARTLLGTRIGCARCHDHPLDDFRQADHLAFAAHFADRRPDGAPGQLFDPQTRRPVAPRLLPLATTEESDDLVDFTLQAGDGRMARVFANRVFAVLLGRGLVEPLDDHRATNPAVLEPVLDALAQELVHGGHDLRALVRVVVLSRLYATASEGEATALAERCFAKRAATPLAPPAFVRAAASALRVEPPAGALPVAPLAFELRLRHGPLLEDLLRSPGNAVDAILDLAPDDARRLEDLFLLLLTRPPTAEERARWLPRLASDGPAFGRDLAFALLASREFGSRR